MNDTLIIKNSNNGFEKVITNCIINCGFDVVEPYINSINELSFFNLLRFRTKIPFLYQSLIENWKNSISKYNTIIIFDNALTVQLVKFIKYVHPSCLIKIWLWNYHIINSNYILNNCIIYTFDEVFAKNNGYEYLPQFYFKNLIDTHTHFHKGVYYIGYDKDREVILNDFSNSLRCLNIDHKFILRKNNNKVYNNNTDIILLDYDVDYDKVLNDMIDYSCLLELNVSEQKGITLRALEALFSSKKLITNNPWIRNYDFYDSNNIFILGDDSINDLPEFLSKEYIQVSPDIIEKYSFDNWIKCILKE